MQAKLFHRLRDCRFALWIVPFANELWVLANFDIRCDSMAFDFPIAF